MNIKFTYDLNFTYGQNDNSIFHLGEKYIYTKLSEFDISEIKKSIDILCEFKCPNKFLIRDMYYNTNIELFSSLDRIDDYISSIHMYDVKDDYYIICVNSYKNNNNLISFKIDGLNDLLKMLKYLVFNFKPIDLKYELGDFIIDKLVNNEY